MEPTHDSLESAGPEPPYAYRRDLAALSSTCRHIWPHAEYWLYIDVPLLRGKNPGARTRAGFRLIDTLAKNPQLAERVRRAHLHWCSPSLKQFQAQRLAAVQTLEKAMSLPGWKRLRPENFSATDPNLFHLEAYLAWLFARVTKTAGAQFRGIGTLAPQPTNIDPWGRALRPESLPRRHGLADDLVDECEYSRAFLQAGGAGDLVESGLDGNRGGGGGGAVFPRSLEVPHLVGVDDERQSGLLVAELLFSWMGDSGNYPNYHLNLKRVQVEVDAHERQNEAKMARVAKLVEVFKRVGVQFCAIPVAAAGGKVSEAKKGRGKKRAGGKGASTAAAGAHLPRTILESLPREMRQRWEL
ncbi:hypothetical protein B0T14DRAFT_599055 [Immersiella caudata]|uniref:Uncharacterized protein n=1 Tax=Immersiella caudata TaxID=314043 RepID=A0AA40CCL7_9PEZI|nr:hypothetical protein B0T14DRAFT_599055 [Immersiella caudata]